MNTILEKIMELGAAEDRACSEIERKLIINEAEELYNKHLAELNLLNIPVVVQRSELYNCECKVCGKPFDNKDDYYQHYDTEHN